MKETYNLKSVIAGLVVLLTGIALIIADLLWWKTDRAIWFNIGCSLFASAVVILFTAFFVERIKHNPLDEWKMEKIYSTRAERNSEADPNIENVKYRIDGIAFGLSTFRTMYERKIENCLKKGVQIRLLTMDPEGNFIQFREEEEKAAIGGIRDTITEMIAWANSLNQKNYKGKIVIRGYKSMTLDYYWRVDDELYVGPYWYGYKSSDTITYKFSAGGRGFQHYSEYFEKLWDDSNLCRNLTQIDVVSKKRKSNR